MTDCIVIGGGVIGLMSALELRHAGLTVTLLERGNTGQESSWAGGGILGPIHPWQEHEATNCLVAWGQTFYPDFCKELHEETGIDPEYYPNSMLYVELDESSYTPAKKWMLHHEINADFQEEATASSINPYLNPALEGHTIHIKGMASLRNPRFLQALHRYAESVGVKIQSHTLVQLSHTSTQVRVITAHDTWEAEHIIIACGAWSQQILPDTAAKPDIQPVKGQMLLFHPKKPMLNQIIVHQGQYLIPRRDGRILAGSTLEHTRFDQSTTTRAAQTLKQHASRIMPALEQCNIEKHWAGLRPGTPPPRQRPYISRHPQFNNLYINAGHYRNGFSLAPASARLLANIITQHTPIVNPAPFALHAKTGNIHDGHIINSENHASY